MKPIDAERSDIGKFGIIAVAIAVIIGVAVPVFSDTPKALAVLGLGPALLAFWNPEFLVVLLQDALGILRIFTAGVGLDIESGFAMATMVFAVAGYVLMAFRYRLNMTALLSPLALLNYAMAAVLAVALVNSGGFEYGLQKLVGFVAFNILSFVLTSITPPERRRRLLYGFVLVGVVALVSVGLGAASPTSSRRAGFGGNPIWTARLLCAAALVTLFGLRRGLAFRVILALLFLGASVFTGSRGPLLTAGIVIGFGLLMRSTLARDRQSAGISLIVLLSLVLSVGGGIAGLRMVAKQQAAVNPRSPFVRIFYGGESAESSTETRADLYGASLAVFGDSPVLGAGLGALGSELQLPTGVYSHNLLLEIASETGLLGLVIHFVTLLLTLLLIIRYLRSPDDPVRADLQTGLLLLLFSYANAQLSGDLVGNKMVWFFLGFINGIIPAWHSSSGVAKIAVHRRHARTRTRDIASGHGRP